MHGVEAMVYDRERGLVISPQADTSWTSPQARAVCLQDSDPATKLALHPAPAEECSCGIHALFAMWDLLEY